MFELIKNGGWVMWPIIACSVAAFAIVGERLYALRRKFVVPETLMPQIEQWIDNRELDDDHVALLRASSPLGQILAAGLVNREHDRTVIKEAIEDAGRHVVPDLERFLSPLGTIAAITPFLGLFGTVIGMISMFAGISSHGVGDPTIVAGGIAQALVTTAFGLGVAIPSLIAYRHLRSHVDTLLLEMEAAAIKLMDILHGERERA